MFASITLWLFVEINLLSLWSCVERPIIYIPGLWFYKWIWNAFKHVLMINVCINLFWISTRKNRCYFSRKIMVQLIKFGCNTYIIHLSICVILIWLKHCKNMFLWYMFASIFVWISFWKTAIYFPRKIIV